MNNEFNYVYRLDVEMNLACISTRMNKPIDEVNKMMKSFGFDEQLIARSRAITTNVTVNRQLTDEEESKLISTYQDLLKGKFKDPGLTVERRGNIAIVRNPNYKKKENK